MIGFLVGWACFGFLVGLIARFLWPGRYRMGCLTTILLGVTGSVVGGFITYALVGGPESNYHPASWLMSIVGAIVVLWLSRVAFGRDQRFD
jgi:uncharacterized membrane protein YeaQ/YmgE (transglycosylase-associated protein family)